MKPDSARNIKNYVQKRRPPFFLAKNDTIMIKKTTGNTYTHSVRDLKNKLHDHKCLNTFLNG